jgi:adenylate kinase
VTNRNCGKIIILVGAPGAGKGTQAHFLEQRCKWPQVSTGDILRTIAKTDTDLGREVARIQKAGDLVSDNVLADVVRTRTSEVDCDAGYILDGFPRTIAQAQMLEDLAREQHREIAAVYVRVERTELMQRLTGRRVCPLCNEIYNIYTRQPHRNLFCDKHETDVELIHRDDDREEVVENRITKWADLTKPVYDYYRETNRLATVNGAAPVEEVFHEICAALGVRV